MDKLYEESETGCCPRFNPEPWDEKEITFETKLFVKDHVRSFFHIPLNFGKVMVKNMEMIQQADALVPTPVMLSDEKYAGRELLCSTAWGFANGRDVTDN